MGRWYRIASSFFGGPVERVILGEHDGTGESAILVDNLSFFMASRLFRLADDNEIWIPLNEGVNASAIAEICGLSVIIDALILFDRVYVQSDFTDRWLATLPRDLNEVVTMVDIRPQEREIITRHVRERSVACARSEHFITYLRTLESMEMEGLMIRSARHYHAADHKWIELSAKHQQLAKDFKIGIQSLNLGEYELASLGGFDARSIVPTTALILASGAFFHQAVASQLGVGYLPHAFRAPFSAFDDWLSRGATTVARHPISLIETARQQLGEQVNAQLGELVCDFHVPGLLSMVLRRTRDGKPNELIENALAIRESRAAHAFRTWLRDASDCLRQGRLLELRKMLNSADILVKAISSESTKNINVKISVTPSVDLPLSAHDIKLLKSRMDLRFLKSVWQSVGETASLKRELIRVWGVNSSIQDHLSDLDLVWQWLKLNPVQDLDTTTESQFTKEGQSAQGDAAMSDAKPLLRWEGSLSELLRAEVLYKNDNDFEALEIVDRILDLPSGVEAAVSRLKAIDNEYVAEWTHITSNIVFFGERPTPLQTILNLRGECFVGILDRKDTAITPELKARALENAEIMIQLYPDKPRFLVLAAQAFYCCGMGERAISMAERALTLDPDNVLKLSSLTFFRSQSATAPNVNLATDAVRSIRTETLALERGEQVNVSALVQARSLLYASLSMRDQQAFAWAGLAWLEALEGYREKALIALRRALDLDSSEHLVQEVADQFRKRGWFQ